MLINFTQKAIQKLSIKHLLHDRASTDVVDQSEDFTWYCNVIDIYSDANVLFLVHKPTLFCYPIVLPSFDDLSVPIRYTLLKVLMLYEIPEKQIDAFMLASQSMLFAKGDNNRRLLGVSNSMIETIWFLVERDRERGLNPDWQDLMINTNAMLHGSPDYKYPIEEFVKRYGGKMLGREEILRKQSGSEA